MLLVQCFIPSLIISNLRLFNSSQNAVHYIWIQEPDCCLRVCVCVCVCVFSGGHVVPGCRSPLPWAPVWRVPLQLLQPDASGGNHNNYGPDLYCCILILFPLTHWSYNWTVDISSALALLHFWVIVMYLYTIAYGRSIFIVGNVCHQVMVCQWWGWCSKHNFVFNSVEGQ